jgi:hypothetical protein
MHTPAKELHPAKRIFLQQMEPFYGNPVDLGPNTGDKTVSQGVNGGMSIAVMVPRGRSKMKITIHAIWLAASMTLAALGGTSEAASMTDFVVYGRQSVQIGIGSTVTGLVGSGSTVEGDGSSLVGGAAGVYGDVRSGNNVKLNNLSFVTGTVTNPGTFSTGAGAWVGSHVTANPDLPTLPGATGFSAGGSDKTTANSGALTLAPGSYGAISLGGNSTLNLSAGDYFFNTLSAGNGLDLNLTLNGGNVRVFVVGYIHLGDVDVLPTGGTAANIYFETDFTGGNAFQASGQVDWLGTVFAPNGQIHLGNGGSNSTFQGSLWGDSVLIEHNVVGTPPPLPLPVPEPATATLLALGLASLGVGHAWRKRAAGQRLRRDVS